jgi:hypothetical protein
MVYGIDRAHGLHREGRHSLEELRLAILFVSPVSANIRRARRHNLFALAPGRVP